MASGFIVTDDYCPMPKQSDDRTSSGLSCPAFSAYFIQRVYFPRSGMWQFTENSEHSAAVLFVNDQQVLSSPMSRNDHVVDVRLAAGVYEVMLGMLHVDLPSAVCAARPQMPGCDIGDGLVPMSLRWESISHGSCDWSSRDDDDDGDDGGADGVGGGAVEYEWVDAFSGGACVAGDSAGCGRAALGDDDFVDVVLPPSLFPSGFPFYGGRKTAMRVSSNGYVTFRCVYSVRCNHRANQLVLPQRRAFGVWRHAGHSLKGGAQRPHRGLLDGSGPVAGSRRRDLQLRRSGPVCGRVARDSALGSGARQSNPLLLFTAERFACVVQPDASGAVPTATFELLLYPSGEIRMQYQETPRSHRRGDDVRASVAVGVENVDGSEGEQISWHDDEFPAPRTAITIPSECEVNRGAGECEEGHWRVRVFHDLHFQQQVHDKCEHMRYDHDVTGSGTRQTQHPVWPNASS